jgi:raffinose/stachyose/melibiose transport system permease protein
MQLSGSNRQRKPFPFHILVFLAPAFIVYTLFMIAPLIYSLRLSLFEPGAELHQEVYVGLQNYQRLLSEPLWTERFWGALGNNFVFFSIHLFVQNPLGLLLASLLSSQFIKGRTLYRTLIFTPTVLSVVLVGFIWARLILNPQFGTIGDLLAVFGIENQPWLGQPDTALPVLSLVSVWQWVGIPMMLFLAALIGIPEELIEAARVDGATAWRIFWGIKFPLILPTVGIVAILTFVGNFNAFDLIYTTQKAAAGPNFSTDILGTFFFRTFFGIQLQLPNQTMGATIAGMMLLIILVGVMIYLFGFQRRLLKMDIQF